MKADIIRFNKGMRKYKGWQKVREYDWESQYYPFDILAYLIVVIVGISFLIVSLIKLLADIL
jgi:hypothetical protein